MRDIDQFLAAPPPDPQAAAATVLDPNHHPRRVAPFIPDHEIEGNPDLVLQENAAMTTFGMEIRETFDALTNQATAQLPDTAGTSTTAADSATQATGPVTDADGTGGQPERLRLSPRRQSHRPAALLEALPCL